MSVAVLILMLVHVIDVGAWTWKNWVLYILTAVTVLAVTFWVGIIRIYVSSRQLGIKSRVNGTLCAGADSGGTSDSPWQADKSGIR